MGSPLSKDESWRSFESDGNWDKQYQNKLLKDINETELPGERKEFRILLVGPVHAGKSAFINSVACIDKNRMADAAQSGTDTSGSMTNRLLVYNTKNQLKHVCLIDVMGLEERKGMGLNHEDVAKILEGNIEKGYEFQPKAIENQNPHYITDDELRWEAHCCAIVVDAEQVLLGAVPEVIMDQIKSVQGYVKAQNNRRVVILSKVDRICRDVKTVFENRKVKEAVHKASAKFSVPLMNIFPVKNYNTEVGLVLNYDILLLMALRRMVQCSCDQIESNISNKKQKEEDKTQAEKSCIGLHISKPELS